jgi:uncharacterized protein
MSTLAVFFREKYGPWALVAGASEGLGAAYAEELAARGINLVLVARRSELLHVLAESLHNNHKVDVRMLALDLSQVDTASEIIEQTKDLDVGLLIYNAAASFIGPFLQTPLEKHLKEIDTNVCMPMILVHAFGQRMMARKRGGMVLMGSLSSFQGSPFIATYSATKAFNLILGESLWDEWRRAGVDVLTSLGGSIRTPNYLASQPDENKGVSLMEPRDVVLETFDALGKQPTVIPGGGNRISSFIVRRVMSRRMAITLMGNILRNMYGFS